MDKPRTMGQVMRARLLSFYCLLPFRAAVCHFRHGVPAPYPIGLCALSVVAGLIDFWWALFLWPFGSALLAWVLWSYATLPTLGSEVIAAKRTRIGNAQCQICGYVEDGKPKLINLTSRLRLIVPEGSLVRRTVYAKTAKAINWRHIVDDDLDIVTQ